MKDAVIVNKGNTWAWLLQREFVKNRNNPQKMFESIDKLLDDYANVFWKLKPSARKMIAEDIHVADRWQEPGTQEITEYKEGLKAVLRYRLRKLFACLYERCILDAKQRLLWEINGFEKQMNTVTEFSVYASDVDGKEIPLSKTEYKDYIAAFAKSPSDKPTIWSWSPGSKDNGKFMCTLYNFITMGTPSFVKFYKTWEDQVEDKAAFTLSFTYSAPAVKLKIIPLESDVQWFNGNWNRLYSDGTNTGNENYDLSISIIDESNCTYRFNYGGSATTPHKTTTYVFDKKSGRLTLLKTFDAGDVVLTRRGKDEGDYGREYLRALGSDFVRVD